MQQQKFTLPEEKKFILFGEALEFVNRGGTRALSLGYVDRTGKVSEEAGNYVEYITAKDSKTGRLIPKRFRFDQSLGRIKTRMSDKDINGVSQYEFLKNHPNCEGSPNGVYRQTKDGLKQIDVVFREYDPEKDAQNAFAADELRINAQATALSMDDATLEEVANILGHYGPVDKAMRVRVIEFAGKRSGEFNELLKAGDRSLRALVRKALAEGEFHKKGSLIFWEEMMLGAEDDAILILQKDQAMIDALKEKLKFNIDAKATPVVNKGGRPRKTDKTEL